MSCRSAINRPQKHGSDHKEHGDDDRCLNLARKHSEKKIGHSAASLKATPRTSSSEQRCIVGLFRQMALVRKKSPIG